MEAQFPPGTTKFFNLTRYRFETGKDYKRIVLYLCTRADLQISETGYQSYDSNDDEPPYKRTQIEDDEVLARQLQSPYQRIQAAFLPNVVPAKSLRHVPL